MKKFFCFFVIAVLSISMMGCSTQNGSNTDDNTENTVTDTNFSENDEELNVDPCYATLIPFPEDYFENGEISIIDPDGGKQYLFQVRNFNDGEYENYIDSCKSMGFSDIKYEFENDGGKMFGAYTANGEYWVEVLLGNDTGIIAVTCKKAQKTN